MTGRRSVIRAAAALAAASVLTGCQAGDAPAGPKPIVFRPVDGVGYVVLNAPISTRTRDFMVSDFQGLIDAGARTIRIGINSPGGDLEAARSLVDAMNAIHARQGIEFETYAIGLVASAATYLFVSGQRRYARPGSGFLFHAAGLVSNGAVSAERLREAAARIDDYERALRAVLRSRTRLSEGAIDVYLHRTVVLDADDARRDGVVDAIRPFPAPPGTPIPTISVNRAAAGQPRPAPPQPGGD